MKPPLSGPRAVVRGASGAPRMPGLPVSRLHPAATPLPAEIAAVIGGGANAAAAYNPAQVGDAALAPSRGGAS